MNAGRRGWHRDNGKNHVRVYSELKSVGEVGVYDLNAAAAQEIALQHGATAYRSIDELLKNVDAVSVCVPTPFHASVVRQIFAAGKSVLIEKPICSMAKESTGPYAACPGRDHCRSRAYRAVQPCCAEIKKIIKKPLYVEMKRHNPASARVTGSSVVED